MGTALYLTRVPGQRPGSVQMPSAAPDGGCGTTVLTLWKGAMCLLCFSLIDSGTFPFHSSRMTGLPRWAAPSGKPSPVESRPGFHNQSMIVGESLETAEQNVTHLSFNHNSSFPLGF